MLIENTAAVKFTAAVCTLGCRVNQYESGCIISEFINFGFEIKNFGEICDVYVINTCTVTAGSDKKSKQMIRRAKKLNKSAVIAVCGCFSQNTPGIFKKDSDLQADIVAGVADKVKIPKLALDILKNQNAGENIVRDISEYKTYENINAYQSEKTRAYIKIQDGCDGNCSYCVIPKVRGVVKSRVYADIYSEIKRFDEMRRHEIVITGIEISSYGKDLKNTEQKVQKDKKEKNIDLITLLEKLDGEKDLKNIKSIRLSSVEPSIINKDFIDRFANLEKPANHFHLSLQSGSSRVLNLMRRKYNIEKVIENISYAKEKIKDLNLTADIIVGFPGETEEDFEKSIEIAKLLKIYHAHIFTYSKRPSTDAADFKNQIDENVKNERSRQLSEVCEKIKEEIHGNCLGREFDVILEDIHDGFYTGKTKNFTDVKIKSQNNIDNINSTELLGTMRKIKITSFDKDFIYGEFL